ncbi:uncharacterized protein LOC141691771 [Apium graveolens]|uniref:uncharacterized protein LOC141691771 n=1 Tax=Apium graveolens TaxID=4045 RepID=UPI003D7A0B20
MHLIPQFLDIYVKLSKKFINNTGLWVVGKIIKDCWEEDNSSHVATKVKKCAESTEVWGREITNYFGKRIKECKLRIRMVRHKRDPESIAKFDSARKQLHLILDQKEIFWRQRSKKLWLQVGDKNTKYFHASCNRRKCNIYIQRLKSEEGEWVDWSGGLDEMIKHYFQRLFTKEFTQTGEILNCIPKSVSEQ